MRADRGDGTAWLRPEIASLRLPRLPGGLSSNRVHDDVDLAEVLCDGPQVVQGLLQRLVTIELRPTPAASPAAFVEFDRPQEPRHVTERTASVAVGVGPKVPERRFFRQQRGGPLPGVPSGSWSP